MTKKQNTGDKIFHKRGDWKFDSSVANSFQDHAKKSIIGYEEGHELIAKVSDFFCLNNSVVLELGIATGELLFKILKHNEHKKNIKYYGIDNQQEMLKKARKHFKNYNNVKIICEDLLKYKLPKSDFTVSYYTIQFIHPRYRQEIFDKIYNSLNWGGAFLLFEKVRGSDARFQDIISNIYTNFKIDKGFSPEEIFSKAESIKGVLEPFSTEGNLGLIKRAGFKDIMTIYKNVCFEGFLCIK